MFLEILAVPLGIFIAIAILLFFAFIYLLIFRLCYGDHRVATTDMMSESI